MFDLLTVKLLEYTRNPEKLTATAAKTCWSGTPPSKIYETITDESVKDMVKKINEARHETPREHAYFTFAVEGISLPAVQQLLRYRIATFNQMSMRYVNVSNKDAVIPPSIMATQNQTSVLLSASGMREPTPYEAFTKLTATARDVYQFLIQKGIPNDEARYALTLNTTTQLVFTMNVVELRHMLGQRLCARASWEIREMAEQVAAIVKEIAPELFKDAGPICEQLGYCPEADMSCGKKPTLQTIVDFYAEHHK